MAAAPGSKANVPFARDAAAEAASLHRIADAEGQVGRWSALGCTWRAAVAGPSRCEWDSCSQHRGGGPRRLRSEGRAVQDVAAAVAAALCAADLVHDNGAAAFHCHQRWMDLVKVSLDGGGGLRWSLRRGRRPSSATTRRLRGATTPLQPRWRNYKHDSGGLVLRCGRSLRVSTLAQGGSWRQRQLLALMSLVHTGSSPPTSTTGAAAPTVWWMVLSDSRRCGVAAARSAPRHGRPPGGCGDGLWWKGVPPIC